MRFSRCWRRLLHYLALGSLLFIFLWLVRLFRTQLFASDASLELIAPFLCSQLHSSPSSSGSSSSSSSSTSLSSSLRSSRSTYEKNNNKSIKQTFGANMTVLIVLPFSSAHFSPCPGTWTCRPCAGWDKPRRCAELAALTAACWRNNNHKRAQRIPKTPPGLCRVL